MPFWAHVGELRGRLVKSVSALAACALAAYALRLRLWEAAREPLRRAVAARGGDPSAAFAFADVSEPFLAMLKLSLWAAAAAASPLLFYQAWAFVRPALSERERGLVPPAAAATFLCFAAGAAFGYFEALPALLGFLLDEAVRAGLRPVLRPGPWIDLLAWTVLSCGLAFEAPVLAWALSRLGLVTAGGMLARWREACVGAVALAAFATPGDVVAASVLFGGVLIALYFVSVAAAWLARRS